MSQHTPPAEMAIRPIRPDDAGALQAFHRRLSPDTVRRRFFGCHPALSDKEVLGFTRLNPGNAAALVATVDGEIIGVGRYNRVGGGDAAEVAFVIEDRYQGHGIGTELLTLLAEIAWGEGIRRFVADTLFDNRPMLDLFHHTQGALAVAQSSSDHGVIHLLMTLQRPNLPALGAGVVPSGALVHDHDQTFRAVHRPG
jgi:RimJ/RimL family protein N-acetyltransferase